MNAIQPAKDFYVIATKTNHKRTPGSLLQTVVQVGNQEELVNALRESTQTLREIAKRLESYLTGQGLASVRDSISADLSFLKSYGSLYIYNDDQVNTGAMARSSTLLDFLYLISMNNEASLSRALGGSVIYGDVIYTLEGLVELGPRQQHYIHQNGKPLAVFHENRLIQGYMCTQCGSGVPEDDRSWHEHHPGCVLKNKAEAMTKDGLVKAEFGVGMAARMAGVSSYLIPSRHDVWVEPWVLQAAELFEHQEGYAGLTLEDFLRKSQPANAAPPLQKETP